jgi:ribosomal protein S18 acetylase RimI-like enzyme
MVSAAAIHGIDLTLMWGTADRAPDGRLVRARQVCLAVPGAGRTAMLMVSGPSIWKEDQEHVERVAAINAACAGLVEGRPARDISLAQALPEPAEPWAERAFLHAGFTKVGDLAYLRRPLSNLPQERDWTWPDGVQVRPLTGVDGAAERALLIEALDRTYADTLDCPELCGLRDTADVLESHRATGVLDPSLWWLVLLDGRPHGCMLLSRCPDHDSVELVYLGLSPELRGKRIGSQLLELGLSRLWDCHANHVACAVDLRNAPAQRLYQRAGFSEFARRIALVRPLH